MNETRREFLKSAVAAAVFAPFLTSCAAAPTAQTGGLASIVKNAVTGPGINWTGAVDAPADVAWKTVLSKETDAGEPIIISGAVFQADGRSPAPETLIYLYHTDTEGFYGRGGDGPLHGRFRGWMLTDRAGRYEFRTIKAAPYPGRRFAAHIHMTVTGRNFKEDSIDSILFEGDRLISAQERETAGRKGGFNPILTLEKGADGILRGRRDIRLWKT
jgi:protocatechuate 3,4-dioxygenase beta subunit